MVVAFIQSFVPVDLFVTLSSAADRKSFDIFRPLRRSVRNSSHSNKAVLLTYQVANIIAMASGKLASVLENLATPSGSFARDVRSVVNITSELITEVGIGRPLEPGLYYRPSYRRDELQ
jgi:hypothetical protein